MGTQVVQAIPEVLVKVWGIPGPWRTHIASTSLLIQHPELFLELLTSLYTGRHISLAYPCTSLLLHTLAVIRFRILRIPSGYSKILPFNFSGSHPAYYHRPDSDISNTYPEHKSPTLPASTAVSRMGLFRRGPRVDYTYKNPNDEARARRRLVDDFNSGRREAGGRVQPGQQFLAPDEKGFLHEFTMGEDGKVDVGGSDFDTHGYMEANKEVERRQKRETREATAAMLQAQYGQRPGPRPPLDSRVPAMFGSRHKTSMPGTNTGPLFEEMDPRSEQPTRDSVRWNQEGIFAPPLSSHQPSAFFPPPHSSHQPSFFPQQPIPPIPPFPSAPAFAPPTPQTNIPPFQHPASQRPPSIVDPLMTAQLPLGARGVRAYVPGQSKIDPRQFGPLDDPAANWRHLKALDALRKKNAEEGRGGGGGGGGGGRR